MWISYFSHHCICVAIYFCPYHFPVLSSFMTYHWVVTRLTRWVPLVEQELLTLSEHLSSPPVFSGVRVTRSLVLCVCFVDRCLYLCTFFLAIVLYVLLPYIDSDYPFGIFKLFLKGSWCSHNHYILCVCVNLYSFWNSL